MSDAELHPRRGHVLLAFLPALTVLLACFVQRPGETDLWWHLRAGEWMVAHGQIPHVDPFSLSRGGEPWTNFEWLYQLAVYGLQCAGGLPLVIFGHAALAAVGFWGALRAAAATTSVSARALAGALAAGTQFIYAFARPQVVTLALTGVYLALLGEQRRVTRGRAGGMTWRTSCPRCSPARRPAMRCPTRALFRDAPRGPRCGAWIASTAN